MKNAICSGLLTLVLWGLAAAQDPVTAEDVLQRALEKAQQAKGNDPTTHYRFRIHSVNDELAENGKAKKSERTLHESFPIGNFSYRRLLEKNGAKPSSREQAKERKRERRFRSQVANGRDPRGDQDNRVEFDRNLTGRFDFKSEPNEMVHGRNCWVLSFKPKPERLPVKKRIDRVLNKSAGRIWIDQETDEISRIEFELQEKVRVWGGLLGKVSLLKGRLERKPLEEGVWMPDSFDFTIKGRVLFSSLHSHLRIHWTDFELADANRQAQR